MILVKRFAGAGRNLWLGLFLCVMAACSPALNWRTVQLGGLSILLPCKPDRASRSVVLASDAVAMDMAGCEAAGALFAISRVQAADAEQAQLWLVAWRAASLANVQATTISPQANSGNAQTSLDVRVAGNRKDGSALQARFKWLMRGTEVYQVAAYADRLSPEQMETLLSELRLQ